MIAIGGLGNPGEKYRSTRHNVGFMVVDNLADKLSLGWENKPTLNSDIAKDREYILLKPLTYVNLSGEAVTEILNFYKVSLTDTWIIHDDTEIPFGEIRVKFGGTSGGHNGVKSIDEVVGTDYWRIRVGVSRPANPEHDLADYVLSEFTAEDSRLLPNVVDRVAEFLVQSIEDKQLTPITFNAKEK